MSGPREARLEKLLRAFAAADELTAPMVAERTGWELAVAQRVIYNAMFPEFVERSGRKDGNLVFYRLSAKGLAKVASYGTAEAPGNPVDRALALIYTATAGLDGEALAQRLGMPTAQVDALLAEHVAAHRLVTCGVQRMVEGELLALTLYRASSGGASTRADFRVAAQAGEAAPGADETATGPAAIEQLAQGIVDRIVATQEPTPEQVKLPVVECDIDAVHFKLQAEDAIRAAAQCAASADDGQAGDDSKRFLAALYSDGVLWLRLGDGRQVDLQPEETRALFRYLDRLAGTALVAPLLPEEAGL